jgi:Domain of unknown function (DUF4383)
MAKTLSTILGIGFILVGIAGFVAPNLLGAHLSFAHNIIHLFSGAVALYFGLAGSLAGARTFCLVFGVVYLLLGVAGFVAGDGSERMLTVIPGALMLGTMDHIIHILLGALFLIGGLTTRAVAVATR